MLFFVQYQTKMLYGLWRQVIVVRCDISSWAEESFTS